MDRPPFCFKYSATLFGAKNVGASLCGILRKIYINIFSANKVLNPEFCQNALAKFTVCQTNDQCWGGGGVLP